MKWTARTGFILKSIGLIGGLQNCRTWSVQGWNHKTLVTHNSVVQVFQYPFVTSELSTTVGDYRRLCEATNKMYRSYLGLSSEKILPEMMISATSMENRVLEIDEWRIQPNISRNLVCARRDFQQTKSRLRTKDLSETFFCQLGTENICLQCAATLMMKTKTWLLTQFVFFQSERNGQLTMWTNVRCCTIY